MVEETMASWSAENATKAYLSTLKMGQKAKEPDATEFISAIAVGNNAKLMVMACSSVSDSIVRALEAVAHQTGGHVICIVQGDKELQAFEQALGTDACHQVEFVMGKPQELLLTQYEVANFVLIDCNLDNHEEILRAVQAGRKTSGTVVVGYNAFCKGSWWSCGSKTQLLPIGEGLLVTKVPAMAAVGNSCGVGTKSRWIVKVDKCTGEEHLFRVRFPHGKGIQA